jgi:hypothetical protein
MTDVPDRRRPRLIEDLGLELNDLVADLGEIDHPWFIELRRIALTTDATAAWKHGRRADNSDVRCLLA